MQNAQFTMHNYLFRFAVLIDAVKRRWRDEQSSRRDWAWAAVRYSLSRKRLIQYSVSSASFNAIESLCTKSILDWARFASVIFAPIEVPILEPVSKAHIPSTLRSNAYKDRWFGARTHTTLPLADSPWLLASAVFCPKIVHCASYNCIDEPSCIVHRAFRFVIIYVFIPGGFRW